MKRVVRLLFAVPALLASAWAAAQAYPAKPIKAVGEHKVQVKLHDSVTANVVVNVIAG